MIAGPVILLVGMALRLPFHFFFPQQLAAFAAHPERIGAAYGCVAVGTIVLAPAVIGLSTIIGRTHPEWASVGGTLVLLGLFARLFHAGADHFALQLVPSNGVEAATQAVATFYGASSVIMTLTPAIFFGWIVLAVAAWRAGVFGIWRAVAMAAMSALMIGVLKGTSATSLIATGGLCVALVPQGIMVLRDGPSPGARRLVLWSAGTVVLIAGFYVLGRLG
jgi:hypothetical protein